MNDRPHVLQICHDYKGPFVNVARQYAGCFPDCDVSTVFLRGFPRPELGDQIPGQVIFLSLEKGALRGLKLAPAREVLDLARKINPQLIIAHRYKPFHIALLLNRRLQPDVILGVVHEFGFLRRLGRKLYSHFWRPNVSLVGVSPPVSREIRETNPHLGGRVYTLPHAIEAGLLHDSVSARHELGIPLGVYCFGFIGRFVRKKNLPLLVRAFAGLADDSVLALVGDGELMPSIQALAKQLGVSDRVIFCGHKDDARRMMKAFDAFVMSSTDEEAFGLVLLEAMAASVPVVCCDAPGPCSVVGDAALRFQCNDERDLAASMQAMKRLTRDELDALTAAAIKRLGEEFAVPVMTRRLRELPPLREHLPVRT